MEDQQFVISPEILPRLAAIDIGSNSMRLIVAEPMRGGTYRILDEERESTRLGGALHSTGRLAPEAVAATLSALKRFKQIADGFQVSRLRTIATCAVREAENGAELVAQAKSEIGIDMEVISADLEGRLAFYSVQRAFDLTNKNVAVADIGGGSTELIYSSGNAIQAISTTPLGAVRLTEIYGNGPEMAGDDFEKLVEGVENGLRKHTKKPFFIPHLLIGSGGTFTSLAEMIMAAKGQSGLPVRGYQVTHAEVSHLLDRLRKMPIKLRRAVPGLSPDRADIIVAGLAVIDGLMRRLNLNVLQVHNRGVRDGLLLTMIDELLGEGDIAGPDRDQSVDRFAQTCGGDLPHGRQVARLAGRIYAQLAETYGMDIELKPLLEAAARLQDVGYLINYDQHHKHSYHLILNSHIAGFQPHDLELIANIARYHRGSKPKKTHANFRQLSGEDQLRVKQLSAILRLAGGLDRSHTQQVRDVQVRVGHKRIDLEVISDRDPEVDLWGARRRTKLFEKVFDIAVEVAWRQDSIPQPTIG